MSCYHRAATALPPRCHRAATIAAAAALMPRCHCHHYTAAALLAVLLTPRLLSFASVVIARQQDKNKDKPYFLPLRGRQLYCHSSAMYVLAAKERKSSKKGSKKVFCPDARLKKIEKKKPPRWPQFQENGNRNARQILDLARPEKITKAKKE